MFSAILHYTTNTTFFRLLRFDNTSNTIKYMIGSKNSELKKSCYLILMRAL